MLLKKYFCCLMHFRNTRAALKGIMSVWTALGLVALLTVITGARVIQMSTVGRTRVPLITVMNVLSAEGDDSCPLAGLCSSPRPLLAEKEKTKGNHGHESWYELC